MPVALVMSLYRHHTGDKAVSVTKTPDGLDITASRRKNRVYLHVVNTQRVKSVSSRITIAGMEIQSGRVFELAGDPEYEVIQTQPHEVRVKEKVLPKGGRWTFPAASVSALELDVQIV